MLTGVGRVIRERTEELEMRTLSPYAVLSTRSRGRERAEEACPVRTCFQRDRDRIIHSKAFRRLKHKTQVFIIPEGDHYRTRLTHTLEVAQISRTVARALALNEDLTEAIALGHDLGHTPFGHGGEQALQELLKDLFPPHGFLHNEQSLRVVDRLERGTGLNLTWEVRDGILNHTGDNVPSTLEGWIVKICDRIAYINHDIDDALRGGILSRKDLPRDLMQTLGWEHSARINRMVTDLIENSYGKPYVSMSPEIGEATRRLRQFLFERVYIDSAAKAEEHKAKQLLKQLFTYYLDHPEQLPQVARGEEEPIERLVCDYVAGMTDRYAVAAFNKYFLPASWQG
ncbi:MAG: deoxyguanosinetriphosphate triphosphohydrolase [Bacillota bacterium]